MLHMKNAHSTLAAGSKLERVRKSQLQIKRCDSQATCDNRQLVGLPAPGALVRRHGEPNPPTGPCRATSTRTPTTFPPQMGGCYENGQAKQKECKMRVDRGPFVGGGVPDALYPEPADSRMQALAAMLKHRESLMRVNPYHGSQALEPAVRAALTTLVQDAKQSGGEEPEAIELEAADAEIAANALRYIRDRVNVPRDMPDINVPRDMPDRVNVPRDMPVWSLIECLDRVNVPRDMPVWSARRLREALELTAAQCNHPEQAESEHPIQLRHRRDQNPAPFGAQGLYKRERATA
eukprot:g54567.t1